MENNLSRLFPVQNTLLAFAVVFLIIGTFVVHSHKQVMPTDTVDAVHQSLPAPKNSSLPEFKNFSTLTDNGLADDQLTGLKYEFGLFSKTLSPQPKTITLDSNSVAVQPRNPNIADPNNHTTFEVTINGQKYLSDAVYSGLSKITLRVFSPSGSDVLYDSGELDINTQNPSS